MRSEDHVSNGEESESSSDVEPVATPVYIKRKRTELSSKPAESQAAGIRAATLELIQAVAASDTSPTESRNEVDDTDGLDPDAEFKAWRLRELARMKREHNMLLEIESARNSNT